MKKIGFLSFMFAAVIITLSSSTCRQPIDEDEVILDTTTNTGGGNIVYGVPVHITVHVEGPAGAGAGGALVKLAYTLDSAVNEKYFKTDTTDNNGIVTFTKLPLDQTTKSKKYFVNAYFSQGGDDLNSMNGGLSNGPVGITVRSTGADINASVIVTTK